MPLYDVQIPDWSEGKPLTVSPVRAGSAEDALANVVAWVNNRAGYHYCDRLPAGTRVYGPGGLLLTLGAEADDADAPVIVPAPEG